MSREAKGPIIPFLASIVLASLVTVACSRAAPTISTQAPVAPSPGRTMEQIKGPTPQSVTPTPPKPTNASEPLDFPTRGKPITIIVPWDAGGGADVISRIIAAGMERDLGTPVQVVNKPGGGTQVGLTEFVRAKPDGYTLGTTNLTTTILTYLDPERKAIYSRKDFAPLANIAWDTTDIAVKAASPYKTTKDLVDAAKARPLKVTMGDSGLMTSPHIDQLRFAKVAGAQFAPVHFSGGTTMITALLGGQVEAVCTGIGSIAPSIRGGQARLLGVMSEKPVSHVPDVPTMESQGYKIYAGSTRSFSAPAGTPKEILTRLSQSVKRAMETDEAKKNIAETLLEARYMDPDQFSSYWAQAEEEVKDIIEEAKKQAQ